MKHAPLSDADRAAIMALKGQAFAVDVAARFGCSRETIHSVWQGKGKAGSLGRRVGRLTDEARERMIAMRASNKTTAEIVIATGFSECTIRLVMAAAREDGDLRADPNPAVRSRAVSARAAGAAEVPPSPVAPADPLVASLMARGLPPIAAAEQARAYHRAKMTRPVPAERVVTVPRNSNGPFRLGSLHALNMQES